MEGIDAQRLEVKKERAPKLPVHIAKEVTKGRLLKHVEISEKSVLPTALDMYREKVDENLKGEIKTHDTSKLRHAEVVEKNVLPTSVDIAREKVPTLIVNFDTEKLKHVDPVVKIALPSVNGQHIS
ncbi:unnamed protein product [Brugia timori]|uniref:BMA-TTH-1, isoform a n=2 Tax=Brugia TaxID=6278 RepID=A0A1I9G1G3_BRUMA|nr:BMA-TTH-1, isoform a [Brugia malayi]VDO11182.1 unnamed protein product [Brugia timori]